MENLFDNLPQLDLSVLTSAERNKTKETEKSPVKTNASGDIPFPLDIDEIEEPESPKSTDEEKNKELISKNILNLEEPVPAKTEKPTETSPETSPIKLISEFLKQRGLISYTDEEFKDEDSFIADRFKAQYETDIQAYKDSLPETIKVLLENYEEGVPLGALLEKEQAEFEYSSITEDQLKEAKNQEAIITNYLMETGWTKDEIIDRVKELEDAGIMEKWAKIAKDKLVTIQKEQKTILIEQSKKEKAAYLKNRQDQINLLQTTIKDTKEFIEGVPTNDLEKKIVFETITKFNKNNQNRIQEFLNDPKNYIKVAYLIGVLKGDFTKLKAAAKTQAVRDIKETLDLPRKSEFDSVNLDALKTYLNKGIF